MDEVDAKQDLAFAQGDVRSEHTGAFLRLSQLVERRSHFSLIFAAVDSVHYRDALIARLNQLRPAARLDLQADDTPEAWLQAATNAHSQGCGVLHLCFSVEKRRSELWWQQANLLRERLADALPGVQVLWLMNSEIDLAAHQAPDLWNWRETVIEFTALVSSATLPSLAGKSFSDSSSADAAEVIDRLGQINRYLETAEPHSVSAAMMQLEAARIYGRLGRWVESIGAAQHSLEAFQALGDERHAAQARTHLAHILWRRGAPDQALQMLQNQVLPVYERLGEVRARAVTLGNIADVLQARGELDEALRIRREEELPVYERVGDVRSRAVTLGQIADVLQARGELSEALRIWREEELPVYEQEGDARARAVTLGKIADVLQVRGELDEALRIRREEELPVYERVGDVRERAVTLGKIADVLQARGELDEALRIRREEQLPVYERVGDVRARAVTLGTIADVLQIRGELDEALRIHLQERLPIAQRLGDLDLLAHIRYSCAEIRLQQPRLSEADVQLIFDELLEAFGIEQKLGRSNAIAVIGERLGSLLLQVNATDEAAQVLQAALVEMRKLGWTQRAQSIEAQLQKIAAS